MQPMLDRARAATSRRGAVRTSVACAALLWPFALPLTDIREVGRFSPATVLTGPAIVGPRGLRLLAAAVVATELSWTR
jgi:hypothetical protein